MPRIETGSEHLHLEVDDSVATITINNADDENRLTPESMAALGQAVRTIGARDDVQAVIVTGAGETFSFGLLNPAIRASMSKEDVIQFVLMANAVFDELEALPQVVVCGINGPLRAGACELALACDIRFAADTATLAMPEATWGGFPGAGAPVRLPGLVGYGRALQLICTGKIIDAAEMLRIGLVEEVHPAAALRSAVTALAQQIAASGPLATRGAKRIMQVRREPGFQAARKVSDALRRELEWSHDVDEGMAAHRENRKPHFTGR